jgi:acyl carrier protein
MTHETTRETGAAPTLDRPATHPTHPTHVALAALLAELLGGEPERYAPDTELFGSLPELDSLALVELITAIEGRFGIELDEDDITAEVFGTVESLAAHVDACTA